MKPFRPKSRHSHHYSTGQAKVPAWRGRQVQRSFRDFAPFLVVFVIAAVIFQLSPKFSDAVAVATPTPTPTPTPADPRFELYKGTCTSYGLAYTDSGENADDRVKVFGLADDQSHMVTVDFMDYAVIVNQKVAACLEAVQRDLEAAGTTYKVREIGGYREERDDRPYFYHQYGAAVDINPATNPQCLEAAPGVTPDPRCDGRPTDIPQEWIDTFERYGFLWGGNFEATKDYMHFEWHGEKP